MKSETLEEMLVREIAEHKAESQEAYHALMNLVPNGKFSEAVEFFVKATYASFWEGWKKRALDEANKK